MSTQDPDRPSADTIDLLSRKIERLGKRPQGGRILSALGTLVTAQTPGGQIGELCDLYDPDRGTFGRAEIVGLEAGRAILAPYGGITGLSERTIVVRRREGPTVDAGRHLLGAVLDGTGAVMRPGPFADDPHQRRRPTFATPPDPLTRRPIDRPFPVGQRAIDAVLTCGEGQRIGIFGAAGLGKSTLISSILDHADYDVCVVALVGERGREVSEFVEERLSLPAAKRMVLVVSTSDRPSLERVQAAQVGTAIAEHFRDAGRRAVLIVDSITRYARALREIGLAAGEPPVRRGFPPSVFTQLPLLFERAGNGSRGTLTAFYTVLAEGEVESDPVAEETRSLLDGHIVLSRHLVNMNWFPAIDILASRSRLMDEVVDVEHRNAANRLRDLVERYQKLELLIRLGEYRHGRDADDDAAVSRWSEIRAFLVQNRSETSTYAETVSRLKQIAR